MTGTHTIWASAWDFQQCGMCDQQSLRSACADPRIFVRGVQVSLTKTLWQRFFFFFFFSPQLILQQSNGQLQRVPEGVQHFPGGSNFFQGGGVQLLIPYRNPYSLWFSRGGGGVRTPCPPSGSPLDHLEFLRLKRRLQSTPVKMSNCWKSHAAAQQTETRVWTCVTCTKTWYQKTRTWYSLYWIDSLKNRLSNTWVNSLNFGHKVNSDTHLQTVEIQIRWLLMSRLIRIFNVCLVDYFVFNSNNYNMNQTRLLSEFNCCPKLPDFSL